ncbi:MAG: SDR family oxidoreductase [Gemmatimonadetes bacterium]|nr:SDR family oxidoreductase [Gemmatimonadota bacterium]
MRRSLAGRVAVVTGASSGIGRATAMALARQGARVALVARSEEKLREVAEEITSDARDGGARAAAEHPRALVVPTDVADPRAVETMAVRVGAALGPVDILVNNAGIGHWSPFVELAADRARRILEVNLFGAFHCTWAFLPEMLERGSGTIVFISSGFGALPFPWSSVYCASKHAVNGFAGALRAEVEPLGVRVILVMPGVTRTGFFGANAVPAEAILSSVGGRAQTPEEVARRVVSAIRRGKRRVVPMLRDDFGLRLAAAVPEGQAWFLARVGRRLVRSHARPRTASPSAGRPGL